MVNHNQSKIYHIVPNCEHEIYEQYWYYYKRDFKSGNGSAQYRLLPLKYYKSFPQRDQKPIQIKHLDAKIDIKNKTNK